MTFSTSYRFYFCFVHCLPFGHGSIVLRLLFFEQKFWAINYRFFNRPLSNNRKLIMSKVPSFSSIFIHRKFLIFFFFVPIIKCISLFSCSSLSFGFSISNFSHSSSQLISGWIFFFDFHSLLFPLVFNSHYSSILFTFFSFSHTFSSSNSLYTSLSLATFFYRNTYISFSLLIIFSFLNSLSFSLSHFCLTSFLS